MFYIKGTRKAKIKVYHHHDRPCEECKDFNLTIGVYQEYFHFFFIPVAATGEKSTVIYCSSCGPRLRSDSLTKEYVSRTRAPFYLYTGLLLIGLLVLLGFAGTGWGAYERSRYISDPRVGDVYLMKASQDVLNGYRFVRLSRINGDSIIAMGNNVLYLTSTSDLSSDDYFSADAPVLLRRSQLKQLYQTDSIQNVYRDYEGSSGFNRV